MKVTIVMQNKDLPVVQNLLKVLKILMRMLYLMLYQLNTGEKYSDDEGNESFVEGGENSNNYS